MYDSILSFCTGTAVALGLLTTRSTGSGTPFGFTFINSPKNPHTVPCLHRLPSRCRPRQGPSTPRPPTLGRALLRLREHGAPHRKRKRQPGSKKRGCGACAAPLGARLGPAPPLRRGSGCRSRLLRRPRLALPAPGAAAAAPSCPRWARSSCTWCGARKPGPAGWPTPYSAVGRKVAACAVSRVPLRSARAPRGLHRARLPPVGRGGAALCLCMRPRVRAGGPVALWHCVGARGSVRARSRHARRGALGKMMQQFWF